MYPLFKVRREIKGTRIRPLLKMNTTLGQRTGKEMRHKTKTIKKKKKIKKTHALTKVSNPILLKTEIMDRAP